MKKLKLGMIGGEERDLLLEQFIEMPHFLITVMSSPQALLVQILKIHS